MGIVESASKAHEHSLPLFLAQAPAVAPGVQLQTLKGGAEFDVLSLGDTGIRLRLSSGRELVVSPDAIQAAWQALASGQTLTRHKIDQIEPGAASYLAALLAMLPSVKVVTKPRIRLSLAQTPENRQSNAHSSSMRATKPQARRAKSPAKIGKKSRNVYVVKLQDGGVDRVNPNLPNIYVGQTSLTPEQRLEQHKNGYKPAKVFKKFPVGGLMAHLYTGLNPQPSWPAALLMEAQLARCLELMGYTVHGASELRSPNAGEYFSKLSKYLAK